MKKNILLTAVVTAAGQRSGSSYNGGQENVLLHC